MRGSVIVALGVVLVVAGCGSPDEPTQRTAARQTVGDFVGSSPIYAPPPMAVAPAASCTEAPAVIVDIINASFTNGEHLEHTQSVAGTDDMTYVGGNIFGPDGKISSQDTWVQSNGAVFSITSDARRRTLLPDGRDLTLDWPRYNDAVSECVGDLERAENQGR